MEVNNYPLVGDMANASSTGGGVENRRNASSTGVKCASSTGPSLIHRLSALRTKVAQPTQADKQAEKLVPKTKCCEWGTNQMQMDDQTPA